MNTSKIPKLALVAFLIGFGFIVYGAVKAWSANDAIPCIFLVTGVVCGAIYGMKATHNLNRLVNFWNSFSDNKISTNVLNQLKKINGFYFSTKYPGDDCQTLTEENIRICFSVVEICKQTVDEIITKESNN